MGRFKRPSDLYAWPTDEEILPLANEIASLLGEACEKRHKLSAFWILVVCNHAEAMEAGIAAGKKNSPTLQEQRRELERLTRKCPKKDTVERLSGQAAFWLERALINLNQYSPNWRERDPADLSEAARLAIPSIRKSHGARREDHPGESVIAGIANIAVTHLNMEPNGNKDSLFRELLCVCSNHRPMHLGNELKTGAKVEFTQDNEGSSKKIKRALDRLNEGKLRFGPTISFGRLNNKNL